MGAFSRGVSFVAKIWFLILFLGLIAFSLFWFARSQAIDDLDDSRFATMHTFGPPDSSIPFTIVYPTRLRMDRPEVPGRQLMAWISSGVPITSTRFYTLTLDPAQYFIFSDSDGKIVPPQIVLSLERLPSIGSVYIRPAPLSSQSALPPKITFSVVTPASNGPKTLAIGDIEIEDGTTSEWRFMFARISRDLALPLTVVIAVFGWIVDYRRQQQDAELQEREKDVQAQIRAARATLSTNLAESLRQIRMLEARAHSERWSGATLIDLQQLRARLDARRGRSSTEQLLDMIDEVLEQGHEAHALDLMDEVAQYVGGDLAGHLQTLRAYLSPPPTTPDWRKRLDAVLLRNVPPPPTDVAVVDALQSVWQQYGDATRELVVRVIRRLYPPALGAQPITSQSEAIKKLLQPFDVGEPHYLRLLRDRRLEYIAPEHKAILYDVSLLLN